MAESNDKQSKNQQFLQQLERQRLLKPCNRAIDLRGKVKGECQAYTFGGITHYLDDRGYLIAKQLLERFKGQYTIGVYESVLKVIKKLKADAAAASAEKKPKVDRAILLRNPNNPQQISFDRFVSRKEIMIVFTTSIRITIEDVQYHASTIDITSSALRIVLKRTHTLSSGDIIKVDFLDFENDAPAGLLLNVSYKIIKIHHENGRTFAVLIRERDDNKAITDWFDNWSEQHNSLEHLDLDYEMTNLANRYYLRLYTQVLPSALLWLSPKDKDDPVKAFHLMPNGQVALASLLDEEHTLNYGLLPIQQVLEQGQDQLIIVDQEKNTSIAVPRNNPTLVAKALNWQSEIYSNDVSGKALLLEVSALSIDSEIFSEQLEIISTYNKKSAEEVLNNLNAISQLVTLSNITGCCRHINPAQVFTKAEIEQYTVKEQPDISRNKATELLFSLSRDEQRFVIRTPISIHVDGKKFTSTTQDVSSSGLSFIAPDGLDFQSDMRVSVDFERWQSQTQELNLTEIPFIMKNEDNQSGQTIIGMVRSSISCPKKVNQFFIDIINKHKDQLAENNADVITNQESHIYSSMLTKSLSAIPFYLGMGEDNKRILQAVSTTQNNHAESLDSLWQALSNMTTYLSETVKNRRPHVFGLYCYQNHTHNDEWTIASDDSFSSASEKAVFINRALSNQNALFFQCKMVPISLKALDRETDLNEKLAQLRHHSPHKVKQIKEVLFTLFAVGELTDITDIITAAYQAK